jgi:hypothetical protein
LYNKGKDKQCLSQHPDAIFYLCPSLLSVQSMDDHFRMARFLTLLLLLTLLSGCVMPGTPRPSSSGSTPAPFQARAVSPTHTSPAPVARQGGSPVLSPLRANPHQPFGGSALAAWTPGVYAGSLDSLPVDLLAAANFGVITGLTNEQQFALGQNGFVVAATQEQYFHQIREQVAGANGQPYYLTTDAAYHALDKTLEVLLAGFEREVLLPQVAALTQATLDETLVALDQAGGTALEQDIHLGASYLAVALMLLAPGTVVDPRLEPGVSRQIQQIQSAGQGPSLLLPDYRDDFKTYQPAGRAAASPESQALYQGLTWYGRAALPPGRTAQILTLALRRSVVKNEDASQVWARLYETTAFLYGSSAGYSPLEYAAWMDEVYGTRYTYSDLLDESRLNAFLARAAAPPAQWDEILPGSEPTDAGWRFFPASFRLDEAFLAATLSAGLDLMAGLGSPAAQSLLLFGALEEVPSEDQAIFALDLPPPLLQSDLNNNWLYAFQAQISSKGEAYPPYMRTNAWAGRDLNAALSAWAAWKSSDPVPVLVPEPQPTAQKRASGPAPAYVEPNPDVFFRLAYISQSLVDGLRARGYTAGPNQFLMADPGPMSFNQALFGLSDLARKLSQFGAIAVRELQGIEPTDEERWLILGCLGPVECTILRAQEYGQPTSMPTTAAASVVGMTPQGGQLQIAAGKLDRIYVAVPLEGKLQIAQGGVLAYYEFARSTPYKFDQWRRQLVNPPDSPAWTSAFRYLGGAPANALVIRSGDVLLVTPNGDGANLRAGPSTADTILQQIVQGDLLTVQAGPVEEGGYTWWFVRIEFSRNVNGWVAGDPLWFERVY